MLDDFLFLYYENGFILFILDSFVSNTIHYKLYKLKINDWIMKMVVIL